jgi:hypothetical protein
MWKEAVVAYVEVYENQNLWCNNPIIMHINIKIYTYGCPKNQNKCCNLLPYHLPGRDDEINEILRIVGL